MLKINPIRAFTLAAAVAMSTATAAQKNLYKTQDSYLPIEIKTDNKITKDEFVSQVKTSDYFTDNSVSVKSATRKYNSENSDFNNAVNFYNDKMSYDDRYSVTRNTYDNLEIRLYNMEKDIDKAFQECEAYQDIVIIPRWHYRYQNRFEKELLNFDIDDIRNRTTKDMQSLYELRDKVNSVIEKANGDKEHQKIERPKYDVDEIAKKHLGMSYDEFKEKYKDEIERFKVFSIPDVKLGDTELLETYLKARDYVIEMLNKTVLEAQTTNWDIGEQKVEEALKTNEDMNVISDFEYDGITKKGLDEINSGISFQAFEDALIKKYNEYKSSEGQNTNGEQKPDETTSVDSKELNNVTKTVKLVKNGKIIISSPDGSVYDLSGRQVE